MGRLARTGWHRIARKPSLAYLPETNMLMPIKMRSQKAPAIVEVDEHKPLHSYAILKLIQRRLQVPGGS